MLRLEIPGSWYADVAGVAGDYAALMPNSHIQTSRGRVELPQGENVLYLRAALGTHGMRLCGQGHQSGLAWLWDSGWGSHGPAHGVSPCIFDTDSRLHIATHAQGSQGYRYVTLVTLGDVLVTGDNTYNSQTLLAQSYGLERIWEWTHLGGVTIGQGEACCLAIGPHGRRVLEPGDCRFVRVQCVGTAYAVAIVKQLEQKAVLLWFQADELATLPLETTTPPVDPDPPVDPPVDDPEPEPEPEPSVPTPPPDNGLVNGVCVHPEHYFQSLTWDKDPRDYINVILAIQSKLWAYGIGSQNRSNGQPSSRLFLPTAVCPDARPPADDALAVKLGVRQVETCWRLMADTVHNIPGSDPPVPQEWTWRVHGQGTYQPVAAGAQPDPDPQPDPQPSTLVARVEALEATVHVLQQNQTDPRAIVMLKQQLDALHARVEQLRDTPSGGTFDPTQWKVETPVKFIGTSIGTIKPKT